MSLINWNNSLSAGVGFIDDDHHRLVEMVNQLHDAMKVGHGKDVLGGLLDGLVEYTRSHFRREEDAMLRHRYPDSAAHKHEHEDLLTKVMDFKRKFASGEVSLTVEVMGFLSNWLGTHIMGSDKKLGQFLQMRQAA